MPELSSNTERPEEQLFPSTEPVSRRSSVPASRTVWVNRKDPGRERNHVVFRTFWTLNATQSETLAVLADYEHFSDWWGRTFSATTVVNRPKDGMVGLSGDVRSRGYLPYEFGWRATVIAADDDGVTLSAKGDFNGTGRFRRPRAGEDADLCFDWDVRIAKPILKFFSSIACPIYLWNHAFAMQEGVRALQSEIEKRRL